MEQIMTTATDQEENSQDNRFLTFFIGNEKYGIEIKNVTEIVGIQLITQIPEQAEYMKGIINLRGRIIPVIDVRLRFKKPFLEYSDRTCVIVVDLMNKSYGLIVDSVSEVVSITEQDLNVTSGERDEYKGKYVKSIGKVENEIILILDCLELMSITNLGVR